VLDVRIGGVALPSIREDLGFSESSLAWVANAYILTPGRLLPLAGACIHVAPTRPVRQH
jgi:hypothetical protein